MFIWLYIRFFCIFLLCFRHQTIWKSFHCALQVESGTDSGFGSLRPLAWVSSGFAPYIVYVFCFWFSRFLNLVACFWGSGSLHMTKGLCGSGKSAINFQLFDYSFLFNDSLYALCAPTYRPLFMCSFLLLFFFPSKIQEVTVYGYTLAFVFVSIFIFRFIAVGFWN